MRTSVVSTAADVGPVGLAAVGLRPGPGRVAARPGPQLTRGMRIRPSTVVDCGQSARWPVQHHRQGGTALLAGQVPLGGSRAAGSECLELRAVSRPGVMARFWV
jgi:hypothetical protein